MMNSLFTAIVTGIFLIGFSIGALTKDYQIRENIDRLTHKEDMYTLIQEKARDCEINNLECNVIFTVEVVK